MSEVIDRPLSKEEQTAQSRLRIIDCDIHPSLRSRADLNEFLPKRWQEHLKTYGDHLRTPYIGTTPYPRSSPLICRRDAWPPSGDVPGSDLAFMRKQQAANNPWGPGATTLEWTLSSPPPFHQFEVLPRVQ